MIILVKKRKFYGKTPYNDYTTSYSFRVRKWFEVYNVSIKNYQNKNGVTILLHTDVYNKLLAKDQGGMLGHVGENPRNSVTIVTPPRFEFSGRMEIWSDEMPESNKGTAKISLKEDW